MEERQDIILFSFEFMCGHTFCVLLFHKRELISDDELQAIFLASFVFDGHLLTVKERIAWKSGTKISASYRCK